MTERVLIAGSGVAAVEAVLALRHLAGRNLEIELVAPTHALVNQPASVATPFGLGAPPPLDLRELADRYRVTLVAGELTEVDAASRMAAVAGAGEMAYDMLLVAVGARPVPALPGALTFRGPIDVPMIEWLLDEAARGRHRAIAIAVPAAAAWTLPAYELAVMAASELRMRGAAATVSVVTPEREPLWLFGAEAGRALRALLSSRGVELRTAVRPVRMRDDALCLASGETLPFDVVVSLPRLEGPRIAGLPADPDGFLPTDAHGFVSGVEAVLAAGDATSFPVKQGGLATQQADAAAETIAAELGAAISPRPFRPVLRGLLLTGGAPLYLRAELEPSGGRRAGTGGARRLRGAASSRALWWPPGKIAGRYLAPYVATARPVALGDEPLVDRVATTADPDPAEHEEALDLTLLLADADEATGDLTQALHALDAAAALSGGVLPAAYAERRERWRQQLTAPAGFY
jgi:sulfide:quinone oxidoreductase